MATAPPFTSSSASLSVDTSFLARTRALQFSQLASLGLPPLYTAVTLYRRHPLTVNRFLRASWIGTASAALLGGGWELVMLQGMQPLELGEHAWAVGHDANRLRSQDYSLIGSFLGALTTSAVLWKRARKVHLVLGGAVLGEAAGFAANLYQSWAAPVRASLEVEKAEVVVIPEEKAAVVPEVGK
ncbi:hypothetical protein CALVIDRAFT_595948 [Calocera viscosa TUFC12733]|uniref:Uncharacterized protein n=1 Tax=Calocera viscosa (strain TUFC12733) TaxID=1330018 RepID=A0A167Q1W2_CALVF|nr:hypothetical protein CALVIDRAFT_595948 [Calocera viscosa TUFC12733]